MKKDTSYRSIYTQHRDAYIPVYTGYSIVRPVNKVQGQSKKMSTVEVLVSTLIGAIISLITQVIVFPIFDIRTTITVNLWIWFIFTVVSIVRGYLIRRLFNYLHTR